MIIANNAMQFVRRTFPQLHVRYSSVNNNYSSHEYCLNLVRKHDYENYLSTLLIQGPKERQCAFSIRAFNVEIAKIAGSVSDDKLGLMRLKFWHDALDKIYDKNRDNILPQHPVIFELNHAIARHKLPKQYLQRLIQARQRSSNIMFATKQELEQYVETSTASAYYLLLKIVGLEDLNADHAASHLGKAQGICNMLRALPIINSKSNTGSNRGALPAIPQEILLAHGCSYERILRQRANDEIVQNCVFDVASLANIHLEKSRKLSDKIPKQANAIFLPAIAIGRYLERLRCVNFQLNDSKLMKRDALLPCVYYWKNIRNTF